MSLNMSVIDTIKKRKSVRTFSDKPIEEATYKKINDYLAAAESLIGPWGRKARLQLVPITNNVTSKGLTIGTYGFIKGPQAYIAGIMENEKEALVEFGYIFEKMVLYLTKLDIGTCWLGGTFTRDSFEKEIVFNDKEIIPAVTPLGYAEDKHRLLESTLRFAVKADKKKPWEQLFYSANFATHLKKEEAGDFAVPLEMVRLGPSASNKQPWRLVLSENKDTCHFYLAHTPKYIGNKLGYDIQRLDMGIAMCHFELTCRELKKTGRWTVKEPDIKGPDEYMEYIVSWETV